MGSAIVTMPGEFMRSRKTYGCYQQMGVTDCIVHTPEGYVEQALRLAQDSHYRTDVQTRIREASAALYEDMAMVAEFQQFLRQVVEQPALHPALP
jgi:predicted O-linked N-acetylglucosamine transferase (SPINDLY family)